MLQSLKQLHGNKLGASNGEIGHVSDFIVDDKSWVICQLVVKTGQGLSAHSQATK